MRLWAFSVFICAVSSTDRVSSGGPGGTLYADSVRARSAQAVARAEERPAHTVTDAEDTGRKPSHFWAAVEVALLPVEKPPFQERLIVTVRTEEGAGTRILIAFSLSALLVAVFLVRCYIGVDLTSLALEMVGLLALFCSTYFGFLEWSYGAAMANPFLTCVALECLFCFDNTLNMFGWYVANDVPLEKILKMIGFGIVVQAVPRLFGLPVLAHYFANSRHAQGIASSLLFLTALRNVYVAFEMKYEKPSVVKNVDESQCAVALPLVLRFIFAEFADLVGNTDSFFAKILVTRDAQIISISGVVALLLPRAFALLLLDQKKFLESRQHFAVRVMLFVSGVMLVIFVVHTNYPKIPDIPSVLKLVIVVILYVFLFFIGYKHIDERVSPRGKKGVRSSSSSTASSTSAS